MSICRVFSCVVGSIILDIFSTFWYEPICPILLSIIFIVKIMLKKSSAVQSFIANLCLSQWIQFSSVPQSCPSLQPHGLTAAHQASLSNTNMSLLKLMFIKSVMPSNHLILCRPLLLPPSIFPSLRVFSNESVLCIRWPKYWASLVALMVKNLPAMQETWVPFLGWEDFPGEGKGDPLQYFCLENPVGRGAWQATVHGVAKNQTRLSN